MSCQLSIRGYPLKSIFNVRYLLDTVCYSGTDTIQNSARIKIQLLSMSARTRVIGFVGY